MERTNKWKRWANLLLSETATRDIVEPFIADYLAERKDNPNVDRSIGRDAARLILSAWWRERWASVTASGWAWMLGAALFASAAVTWAPTNRAAQLLNVLVSAVAALVVLTASPRFLRALARIAPLGLFAVLASLALFGLEAEGSRAWVAAGPLRLQPGLLALPLVVLALSNGGWRGSLLVGVFASAMLGFGEVATVIACAVAVVVAGVSRRLPWALPAAAAGSIVLAPILLGDAPALFVYGGSATLAFLVIVALGARTRTTRTAAP